MDRSYLKQPNAPMMWAEFVLHFSTKDNPVSVQFIAEKGYYLTINVYEDLVYSAAFWLMRQVVKGEAPLEYAQFSYVGSTGTTILFAAMNINYTLMISINVSWDQSRDEPRFKLEVVRN